MTGQQPDEDGMMIGELARKANVSVRTIRFYIAEGLLPAPQARGRFASYDEDALLRLHVIRHFKDAFLPLREIRKRLSDLSTPEVRALLSDLEQKPAAARTNFSTAVDYIDQLTARREQPPRAMAAREKQPETSFSRGTASLEPQPRREFQPEQWRHYRIAPGVILLASDALGEANEKRLEELLQFSSRLFSSQGVKHV